MTFKTKLYILLIAAVAALLAAVYYIRPPGVAPSRDEVRSAYKLEVSAEGKLPGITWADDIHPIFTRNTCIRCHTRSEEAIAEGFREFALGLVDPEDKNNAFWSYHELVYATGPPQVQQGETNRDGQCCWPREFPETQQRRIWIGHPERSAIMRKLEQDYFDWRNPPRFFEEGLELSWGLPMPMYPLPDEIDIDNSGEDEHEDENNHEHVEDETHDIYYEIRPFYERILLHLRLWSGGGKDQLRTWPPRIPARDRALLRYWISNSMQTTNESTGIEFEVLDSSGQSIEGADIKLIGNYTSPQKKDVSDHMALKTGPDGRVTLSFPKNSVLSSVWYAAAEHGGVASQFRPIVLREGSKTDFRLELPISL